MNTNDLREALRSPFPGEDIHFRVGSTFTDSKTNKLRGLPLAYLDARDVEDRLDEVCGIDGWRDSYRIINGRTICLLELRVGDEWIGKEGLAGDTDVEAEKGAESDALKRACVKWGIGRYLYRLKGDWVDLSDRKAIPEKTKTKLAEDHDTFVSKLGWGGPAETAILKFLLHMVQLTVKTPQDVAEFRRDYRGMIPQLRVKHRAQLEKLLAIIEGTQEKAA